MIVNKLFVKNPAFSLTIPSYTVLIISVQHSEDYNMKMPPADLESNLKSIYLPFSVF